MIFLQLEASAVEEDRGVGDSVHHLLTAPQHVGVGRGAIVIKQFARCALAQR